MRNISDRGPVHTTEGNGQGLVTHPALGTEMVTDRNENSWTSDRRPRYPGGPCWHATSESFDSNECCSKIIGMILAIRGMVLISYLVDRSVVRKAEPTVFMATYFTCHRC